MDVDRVQALTRSYEEPVPVAPSEAKISATLRKPDPTYLNSAGRENENSIQFIRAHSPAAPEVSIFVASDAVCCSRPAVYKTALVQKAVTVYVVDTDFTCRRSSRVNE